MRDTDLCVTFSSSFIQLSLLEVWTMSSAAIPSQAELKANKVPLGWRDQCSSYVLTCITNAQRF